jgi:hypothetical protein
VDQKPLIQFNFKTGNSRFKSLRSRGWIRAWNWKPKNWNKKCENKQVSLFLTRLKFHCKKWDSVEFSILLNGLKCDRPAMFFDDGLALFDPRFHSHVEIRITLAFNLSTFSATSFLWFENLSPCRLLVNFCYAMCRWSSSACSVPWGQEK